VTDDDVETLELFHTPAAEAYMAKNAAIHAASHAPV